MKKKKVIYDQLDIFGNWVKMDLDGNVYPEVEYRVELRLAGPGEMFFIEHIKATDIKDVEKQIPVLIAKWENDPLSDNCRISSVQIINNETNKLVREYQEVK